MEGHEELGEGQREVGKPGRSADFRCLGGRAGRKVQACLDQYDQGNSSLTHSFHLVEVRGSRRALGVN